MFKRDAVRAHAEVRRVRKGIRRRGIMWDFNLDGSARRERIKGFWKRYWRRWVKREVAAEGRDSNGGNKNMVQRKPMVE